MRHFAFPVIVRRSAKLVLLVLLVVQLLVPFVVAELSRTLRTRHQHCLVNLSLQAPSSDFQAHPPCHVTLEASALATAVRPVLCVLRAATLSLRVAHPARCVHLDRFSLRVGRRVVYLAALVLSRRHGGVCRALSAMQALRLMRGTRRIQGLVRLAHLAATQVHPVHCRANRAGQDISVPCSVRAPLLRASPVRRASSTVFQVPRLVLLAEEALSPLALPGSTAQAVPPALSTMISLLRRFLRVPNALLVDITPLRARTAALASPARPAALAQSLAPRRRTHVYYALRGHFLC